MRDSSSILGYSAPAALIAMLAMLPFVGGDGGAPPPAAPQAESVGASTASLIAPAWEDFRVGRLLIARAGGTAPHPTLEDGAAGADEGGRDSTRVLIALLPDPDASSLDWMFDAHLASLRRAIEQAGYATDRMWMPSSERRVSMGSDSAAGTLREAEAFPGVMVFRGSGGASTRDLLLVYLVGELPTSGVHQTALYHALREAHELSATDTLGILGPTFSGSAASLRATLEAWRQASDRPCNHLRIVTGSATGSSVAGLLRAPLEPCALPRSDGEALDSLPTFQATVHTDDLYGEAVARAVFDRLRLPSDQVALLVESNTGYGHDAGTLFDSALVVPFPLNIASMRSEYDRRPQPPEGPAAGAPTARLPLSLHVEPRVEEAPPVASRLTAPALDVVTDDILRTLRDRRVRAVGILATDVRDKLFLAALVRRELRDALLFTFEGHALYLHADVNRTLRGMVVLSSYPLTLGGASGSRASPLVPFSSDGAAGVYNAAALLLERPDILQRYRTPLDPDTLASAPPIWVSTIGSRTVLPVTAIVPEGGPGPPRSGIGATSGGAPSRPGVLDGVSVLVLLVGLASASAVGLRTLDLGTLLGRAPVLGRLPGVAGALVGRRLSQRADSLKRLWSRSEVWVRRRKDWDVLDGLAVTVALLAFFAPFALLNVLDADPGTRKGGVVLAAGWLLPIELLLLLAFLLVAIAYLLISGRLTQERRGERSALALGVDLVSHGLCILLGGLAVVYSAQILGLYASDPLAFAFYRLRALQLDSGASALLMLLVIAIGGALAVGWHRDRRRLLTDSRPFEDVCMEGALAGDRWDEQFRQVRSATARIRASLDFRHAAGATILAAALVLVIVLVGGVYSSFSYRTLEDLFLPAGRASTTIILWTGLLVGLLSICAAVVHLVIVWLPLKKLLQGLAETPLAPAFERIPPRLRSLGRLHLFDPPAASMGEVLAGAGHQSVWESARSLAAPGGPLEPLGAGVAPPSDPEEAGGGSSRPESLANLLVLVRGIWRDHPALVWSAGRPREDGDPREALEIWLRHAEDVVAVEVTRYLEWVLRHVRRIALLLLSLLLFTTALLEVLPFPFHAMMTTLFVVLTAVGVGTVVLMMVQLAQDDVLSRITGTEPGRINWNAASLISALVFVAVPVVALLATEVAPVGQAVFGWVGGLLRLLSTV
jgi:hypothetical protein